MFVEELFKEFTVANSITFETTLINDLLQEQLDLIVCLQDSDS